MEENSCNLKMSVHVWLCSQSFTHKRIYKTTKLRCLVAWVMIPILHRVSFCDFYLNSYNCIHDPFSSDPGPFYAYQNRRNYYTVTQTTNYPCTHSILNFEILSGQTLQNTQHPFWHLEIEWVKQSKSVSYVKSFWLHEMDEFNMSSLRPFVNHYFWSDLIS